MTDSRDADEVGKLLSTAVTDSITSLRDAYETTIKEWCDLLHITPEIFAERFMIEEYPMQVTDRGDGKFEVAQRVRLVRRPK